MVLYLTEIAENYIFKWEEVWKYLKLQKKYCAMLIKTYMKMTAYDQI